MNFRLTIHAIPALDQNYGHSLEMEAESAEELTSLLLEVQAGPLRDLFTGAGLPTVDAGGEVIEPSPWLSKGSKTEPAEPAACGLCGSTKLYDNREKKAKGEYGPKSPDFKCSGCRALAWVGKEGEALKWVLPRL